MAESAYEAGIREMFEALGSLRLNLEVQGETLESCKERRDSQALELRNQDIKLDRAKAAISLAIERSEGKCIACRQKIIGWEDIGLCVDCRLDSFKHGMPR